MTPAYVDQNRRGATLDPVKGNKLHRELFRKSLTNISWSLTSQLWLNPQQIFFPFWTQKLTISITVNRTHWGRIVVGCGTLHGGGLWACRPPAAPAIPAPGSAGWVFSPALAPLAWRSGSRADWLPKHTQWEQMSRGGVNYTNAGLTTKGKGVHALQSSTADLACRSASATPFGASLVFCLPVHLILSFLLFI